MFRFFSKTVSVAFVDDSTGVQIAASDVPLDQLPDTFAIDTELDMAGTQYVVTHAQPQTKAEFAKSKRLIVKIKKVELLDLSNFLFSLPTICGAALPESGSGNVSDDIFVLHEDDWRQCEFVANTQHEEISAELSSIRHIHATADAEVGWRKVHVRERIARPLPSGMTWTEITKQIGPFEPVAGIAFGERVRPVLGAVAARLPGDVILWGIEETGELSALCVEGIDGASKATISALKRVADTFSLTLIHWCRCQAYSSEPKPIANAAGAPWDSAR